MNTCSLSGRLVADPELKTVNSDDEQIEIGTFRVAVWRTKEATDFVNVTVFGGQWVERVARLKRGDMVVIDGRLRHESWPDKSGGTRHALRVVADEVYPIDTEKFFGAGVDATAGAEDAELAGSLAGNSNTEGGLL